MYIRAIFPPTWYLLPLPPPPKYGSGPSYMMLVVYIPTFHPPLSIRAPLAEHQLRGVSETGSPVRELPAANAERLQHQDAPGQAGRLFANWLRGTPEHIAADSENSKNGPDANHRHLLRPELRPQAANVADNRWADHIVAHSGGMLNSPGPGRHPLDPLVMIVTPPLESRPMAGPEGCPQ